MLSHTELRRAYRAYNRKYFAGALPVDCDVMFAPIDGCYAQLTEDHGGMVLQIDTKYAINSLMWRQSLLHEMAHLSSGDWKHGKRFQREIDRLYAAGAFRRLL